MAPSRAPPVHSLGETVNTQFPGGLRTQFAASTVYGDAVGGGEAAANRIAIHRSPSKLCTETPGKVCIHTFAQTVYGRGPGRGLLQRPTVTDPRCYPSRRSLLEDILEARP